MSFNRVIALMSFCLVVGAGRRSSAADAIPPEAKQEEKVKEAAPSPPGGSQLDDVDYSWSIKADSQLQTVNAASFSASFGLGLEYATPRTQTSLIARKGTTATIEGPTDDPKFGRFLLDPASANYGASFQTMLFVSPSKACYVPKGDTGGCANRSSHAIAQFGFIGGFDYGTVNTTVPGVDSMAPASTGTLHAISFLTGAVVRIGDSVPINGSKMPIALGLYLGPTFRYLGVEGDRSALFTSSHKAFGGLELGAFFRLASADVTARLTWTGPEDTANSVTGLTGLGGLIRVTFALPFSIVKTDTEPSSTGKPSATDVKGTASAGDQKGSASVEQPAQTGAPAAATGDQKSETVP